MTGSRQEEIYEANDFTKILCTNFDWKFLSNEKEWLQERSSGTSPTQIILVILLINK